MESLAKIPKTAFLLRGTTVEIIESLPDQQKGKVAMWIVKYGITGQCEEYEKEYIPILRPIFSDIDVEKRRYENKKYINGKINRLETVIKSEKLDERTKECFERIIKALKKIYVDVRSHDISNVEEEIVEKLSLHVAVKFHLVDSKIYYELIEKQKAKETVKKDNRYMAHRGGNKNV